jgi:hypothetical protein
MLWDSPPNYKDGYTLLVRPAMFLLSKSRSPSPLAPFESPGFDIFPYPGGRGLGVGLGDPQEVDS